MVMVIMMILVKSLSIRLLKPSNLSWDLSPIPPHISVFGLFHLLTLNWLKSFLKKHSEVDLLKEVSLESLLDGLYGSILLWQLLCVWTWWNVSSMLFVYNGSNFRTNFTKLMVTHMNLFHLNAILVTVSNQNDLNDII
jgi:hypothetical protein